MSGAERVPDLFPTVLARFAELGETRFARRLAELPLGPTSVWDALRYEIADLLFDDAYRALRSTQPRGSQAAEQGGLLRSLREMARRNLWQAQIGEEVIVGLLSARLGWLGDRLEKRHADRDRRDSAKRQRTDVLVAGSLYRTAVARLAPALRHLRARHALDHVVLVHDDVLLRHRRAFARAGLEWRSAAAFSTSGHEAAARELLGSVCAALADAEVRQELPQDFVSARFLSPRSLRRQVTGFLAASEAMSEYEPSVIVIPDQRQALARLVGLEAARRGIPVLSAPLDRDQIFRKTPLWGPLAATRTLAFCPLAARFLSRAGVEARHFELASARLDPSGVGEPVATSRKTLALGSDTRVALFASQGQTHNAVLLPMVKESVAALPDVELTIRPHPYETRTLVKLMNPDARVSTALSARQALLSADVVITHSSFMAMEAALLGRPVVLVSPDPVPSLLPLLAEGVATWVCDHTELRRTLADLLGGGAERMRAAQERLRAEQARVPGPERIADVIAELRAPARSSQPMSTKGMSR